MTQLKTWTVIVLWDMAREKVLLLHRSSDKKLLPDLITGIGGKVELEMGEAENIEDAALRELEEETCIRRGDVQNLQMRLATILTEDGLTRLLYWMTGVLTKEPETLVSTEGMLQWHPKNQLPLPTMTKAAKLAIPFVLDLPETDMHIYSGAARLQEDGEWLMNII